jgi:hypothetical protein
MLIACQSYLALAQCKLEPQDALLFSECTGNTSLYTAFAAFLADIQHTKPLSHASLSLMIGFLALAALASRRSPVRTLAAAMGLPWTMAGRLCRESGQCVRRW